MRLLQLHADGELTITRDLLPHEIPQYAILSHTWGNIGDEVTLSDIMEDAERSKLGYQKIFFCAEQAAADGLEYFWVDTCCIDKYNHTEYSEAINSMFRWYQNSTRCYVYLSDVQVGCPVQVDGPVQVGGSSQVDDPAQVDDRSAQVDDQVQMAWKVAFRNSRWFTRGWTLQEMIAPSSVQFFSSEGQLLGDVRSLYQEIHDITKIPAHVLQGSPFSALSVEERMSWSNGRQTTRPEDKAYSLWGLFGIHMSPIYGEGEDEAFERLRREISSRSISVTTLLGRLPTAHGASFDSQEEEHNTLCLADTRVELLREITEWAHNPASKAVYWLNGMAGTGKSTVSRTLAHMFQKEALLGATFFFKRGEGDRGGISKFITTVAGQLILTVPETAAPIQSAIDADPVIFSKATREQFDKLIMIPLSKVPITSRNNQSLVVIIDALDECERDEDVKLLIKLFSTAQTLQPRQLKIFFTSRPELPIRLGFNSINGEYQDFVLHEIVQSIIEHDITAFLKHELRQIQHNYNSSAPEEYQLPNNWPSQTDLQTLVQMAVPLFIFAATVCRFIADERFGSPDEQLEEVLQYQTKSQESQLDATYLPVLNKMISGLVGRRKTDMLDRFRNVVGSIIILATPLSSSALGQLLGLPVKQIATTLNMLHSVLNIPQSPKQPIRLLHLSFRDFILDPEKQESPFWVNEKETHSRLAAHCLRIMGQSLRTDVCEVQHPGALVSSIQLDEINERLPPEVQYACRFWAYHLQQADEAILDDNQVWDFLTTHFLHWLEALSWMRKASESLQVIKTLQSIVQPGNCNRMSAFLNDALRFIFSSKPVTQNAPLQVYSSALVFAPEKSAIRLNFEKEIPTWILSTPKVRDSWGGNLQTIEAHKRAILAIAFSFDSQLLASGSVDKTLALWDVDTGDLRHSLGHESYIKQVAFSPNGQLIASVSHDQIVRLWDVCSGDLKQTLSHDNLVNGVAFSPDGQLAASASDDRTVRLWDVRSGALQQTRNHTDTVEAVTFSPDDRTVVSLLKHQVFIWDIHTEDTHEILIADQRGTAIAISPDGRFLAVATYSSMTKSIQLWSTETRTLQKTFMGHDDIIRSVAFSPDGGLVASASNDYTMRIWNVNTAQLQQTFSDHKERVNSVAYSPDGRLIASASTDQMIRLYALGSEDSQTKLESHSNIVRSVRFSPNGRFLASASSDQTVRIWTTKTGALHQKLEGHDDEVFMAIFSPDSLLLASASLDKTIRLWSVETGCLQKTFRGHSQGVTSVAFSPNGSLLASGSLDQTVRLWGVDVGLVKKTLEGHNQFVHSVVFSPDGRLVASGSDDRTVRIWAASTGELQQKLLGHKETVIAVAFSPNGRMVASASFDQTIRLWDIESGNLLQVTDIGTHCLTLGFDAETNHIYTDTVTISIEEITDDCVGYGFSTDRCWLTLNKKNTFWFPPEYRPLCSATLGSTIVIGCDSGRVMVLRFEEQDGKGARPFPWK